LLFSEKNKKKHLTDKKEFDIIFIDKGGRKMRINLIGNVAINARRKENERRLAEHRMEIQKIRETAKHTKKAR
jgi:hypothetical protein